MCECVRVLQRKRAERDASQGSCNNRNTASTFVCSRRLCVLTAADKCCQTTHDRHGNKSRKRSVIATQCITLCLQPQVEAEISRLVQQKHKDPDNTCATRRPKPTCASNFHTCCNTCFTVRDWQHFGLPAERVPRTPPPVLTSLLNCQLFPFQADRGQHSVFPLCCCFLTRCRLLQRTKGLHPSKCAVSHHCYCLCSAVSWC